MTTFITRHPFDPKDCLEDEKTPKQRLMAGTKESSIVIDATEQGLVFNAFYTATNGNKYAVVRKPVRVRWSDLEKIKEEIINHTKRKKRRKKKAGPDRYEEPSKEYLESLPIVTLNGSRYYFDAERKERRPVEKPNSIYSYKDIV